MTTAEKKKTGISTESRINYENKYIYILEVLLKIAQLESSLRNSDDTKFKKMVFKVKYFSAVTVNKKSYC